MDPMKLLHQFPVASVEEELARMQPNPHLTDQVMMVVITYLLSLCIFCDEDIDALFDLTKAKHPITDSDTREMNLQEYLYSI